MGLRWLRKRKKKGMRVILSTDMKMCVKCRKRRTTKRWMLRVIDLGTWLLVTFAGGNVLSYLEVCDCAMLQWVTIENNVLNCVERRGYVEEKDLEEKVNWTE